ncbi:MAG: hypothetical protein II989_05155 [Bacteroidales bacterium]|nr:hypothetical protein [Bacteroidales bacterium]
MKAILVVLTTILTSFYFFPFEFVFLPGVNTKMAMAGVGLVWFGFNIAKGRKGNVDKDFFILSLIALSLSLFSLVAMVYNNTRDGSFLTYFVSMWVWLGGAYTAINVIKKVHGYVSVELVCNYLIAVCVAQCIIAYSMTIIPWLKSFVDSFLGGNDAFMGKAGDRMYGVGAALDVSGLRFSAVLVMIAFLSINYMSQNKFTLLLYVIAFLFICVVGNMMGRTTTVGVILSFLFWIVFSINYGIKNKIKYLWILLIILISIILPFIIIQYNVNPDFKEQIRFAFEGFFSMAETGRWETGSNNILLNRMIVFPETLKTWLIGDGYGANPSGDPYYIGPDYHGFYMGTDIGYLRFLFYFGIFGAIALVSLICYAAASCIRRFPSYKIMFLLILAVNLIVWFKVSTDIFMVFALFLCIPKEDNDAYEKQYENPIPDQLDL